MCSIFGAIGHNVDNGIIDAIREAARDRGRDGGRMEAYPLSGDRVAVLGNWRATPTTEIVTGTDLQPYDGVVHNGTIANDHELGNPHGVIDSRIIPVVIDRHEGRTGVSSLAHALRHLKGSFALAVRSPHTVFLAANYKPLHYLEIDGSIYFSSMERHLSSLAPFGRRPVALDPYSVLDLTTHETVMLPRHTSRRALVICSSGLDSTTVAYVLRHDGWSVDLVHFMYGCHAQTREVNRVRDIAADLGCRAIFQSLDYGDSDGDSPLLTDGEIATGVRGAEFAHEWVPARNLLMVARAVAYAEANDYGAVALGNNLEESGAFPDNEERFTELLNAVLPFAVQANRKVELLSPVGNLMKHEIVALGTRLGVPFGLTWSCYRGGDEHCGVCGPCHMRRIAFMRNGLTDPVFQDQAVMS
ncbi:7-cyano-7-deazaguanine synthase [Paraburkholderia adhaesiva]|uniref:7-cyano-7-deazaguanine synthase n=1 Tax=Paraburkholderia adhaesiva TaxID=2883244 RepID=UPI001F31C9E8|nr:7-cyano-7-deazaguanine synthase [Paraburkholderia adhaesiva]